MRDGGGHPDKRLISQDATVRSVVEAYLDTLGDDAHQEASATHLAAAFSSESLSRGCPTLAMLTVDDIADCRRDLERRPEGGVELLATLEVFMLWAGSRGTHSLSPAALKLALAGSTGSPGRLP